MLGGMIWILNKHLQSTTIADFIGSTLSHSLKGILFPSALLESLTSCGDFVYLQTNIYCYGRKEV